MNVMYFILFEFYG